MRKDRENRMVFIAIGKFLQYYRLEKICCEYVQS